MAAVNIDQYETENGNMPDDDKLPLILYYRSEAASCSLHSEQEECLHHGGASRPEIHTIDVSTVL